MSINNITILGRLTKDPELKYMQSGTAVVNFTVAVDRDYKNQDGTTTTDFLPVQFMGKTSETIANHFTKGRAIAVIGSMRVNKYEQEGQKKSYTFIAGKSFSFVSGDNKGNGSGNSQPSEPAPSEFNAVDDDDVPF